MVATNSAVNWIGVEEGAKSKIGEARFLLRGLAISPPGFSRFCKRVFPPDFFRKKKNGGNSWGPPPNHAAMKPPIHFFGRCASRRIGPADAMVTAVAVGQNTTQNTTFS